MRTFIIEADPLYYTQEHNELMAHLLTHLSCVTVEPRGSMFRVEAADEKTADLIKHLSACDMLAIR